MSRTRDQPARRSTDSRARVARESTGPGKESRRRRPVSRAGRAAGSAAVSAPGVLSRVIARRANVAFTVVILHTILQAFLRVVKIQFGGTA